MSAFWKLLPRLSLLLLVSTCPQITEGADPPPQKEGSNDYGPVSPGTAAALLDQAIWWPGDFAQIRITGNEDWSFEAPPIPAYGTVALQDYVFSKTRIAELNQNRPAIAAELVKRLKAFDWKKFPAAPQPAPELPQPSATRSDSPDPKPSKPANPLALGAVMLRIIEATEAVETLPELLRLEEALNTLNEAAIKIHWQAKGSWNEPLPPVPKLYVPPIETGEPLGWKSPADLGKSPEITALYAPGKRGEKLKLAWDRWESRVYSNILFQREILGVSLGLLEKQGNEALRQSLIGRITALGRRKDGLALMKECGIHRETDLTAEQRGKGLIWDATLGVPRHNGTITRIPWSKAIRAEARQLIQSFIRKEPVPPVTGGAALLEDSIASPGDYNQMCSMPPPLTFPLPMPAGASLVSRHFNLAEETVMRLQANRSSVIPVLAERLKNMGLESPPAKSQEASGELPWGNSGQDSRYFGPLLLQVVQGLNAVECLPDILRLEQQLTELIARAEADNSASLPGLPLDSPIMEPGLDFSDSSPAGKRKTARALALFGCKIYQRELLGLMRIILEQEECVPIKSSAFFTAQRKELEDFAFRIKSEADLLNMRAFTVVTDGIVWDRAAKKARVKDNKVGGIQTAYTPAIRDEIRTLAAAYLKDVPPDKRRAGDGMILSWLEKP